MVNWYADHTQLYISVTTSATDAIHTHECCLASVLEWTKVNRLSLNPDKIGLSERLRIISRLDGIALLFRANFIIWVFFWGIPHHSPLQISL